MRAGIGRTSLSSWAALAAAMALASPAGAQETGSVSDYRLPDPKQTARPTQQGPADPENPYGLPSRPPRAEQTPAPAPTPTATAPRITLPPPTTAIPAPQRQTARPTATPTAPAEPTPSPSAAPIASPSAAPPPEPGAQPTPVAPAPDAAPYAMATEPEIAASLPQDDNGGPDTLTIAGALGALVVAGAAFALLRHRRRSAAQQAQDAEAPAAHDPGPQPSPPVLSRTTGAPAVKPARQTDASAPAPTPATQTPAAPGPAAQAPAAPLPSEPLLLTATFVPQAVRLSLVYATLQYELEIANAGSEALPAIEVRADLASAHASIATREQLAPEPQALVAQHTIPALLPGQSTTLKGELRLPLQQVRPLVKGNARFFVPLARFCFLAPDGRAVRRVYTLGPRAPGSAGIASVRLDAGPRNLRELDSREIEAARGFALDPVAAQG